MPGVSWSYRGAAGAIDTVAAIWTMGGGKRAAWVTDTDIQAMAAEHAPVPPRQSVLAGGDR
jgi:hypothetical protein